MSCPCCYKVTLLECPEIIILDAGLTPNTAFWYTVTDKFGTEYKNWVETNHDGQFIIPSSDFPKGFFMSFSGSFEIRIYSSEENISIEGAENILSLCGSDYSCVIVDFSTDTSYSNVIPDCSQTQAPIVEEEICQSRPDTFCDAVKECIGITSNGSENKYLNEKGQFVELNVGGDETDPIFLDWLNTTAAVDNWNAAYSWGNHADAGYAADSDLQAHVNNTNNPHGVTKAQVGLGNVDNTSDVDKPVSTAQATADTNVLNAAKSYADSLVVGLLDDRGNYNASVNTFPTTGGSGAGGAILKGDLWTVSVGGTLGGQAVTAGDTVRALVDSPGQTSSNWAVSENNIGYVAENQSNKATAMTGNETSNVAYLSAKAVYDWVVGLGYATQAWVTSQGFITNVATALGYTPENAANKSSSVVADQASTTKYPTVKALYDWATGAFQAASNILTALASLNNTKGFLAQTGASTFERRTLVAGAGITISNPTGESGNPTIAHSGVQTAFYLNTDDNSNTGSTSEAIVKAVLIPANTISAGKIIDVKYRINRISGSAGNIHSKIRISTSAAPSPVSGATNIASAYPLATIQSFEGFTRTFNCKSATSTTAANGTSPLASDIGIVATARDSFNIDWTVDQYLLFTLINGSAADTSAIVLIFIQIF